MTMTIKEFTDLSYGKASEHIRSRFGKDKRIPAYYSDTSEQVANKLGLSDAVPMEFDDQGNWKSGNFCVNVKDQWYITRLRVIVSIKYDDKIKIDYYIGNTGTGPTLKEIGFSGLGIYWSGDFKAIKTAQIRTDPTVGLKIQPTTYRNGRKGSVSDMLSREYGLLKMRYDCSAQHITKVLESTEFIEAWTKKDIEEPGCTYTSYLSPWDFGMYMTKLLSDTRLGIDDIALALKIASYHYRDINDTRFIASIIERSDTMLPKNFPDRLSGVRARIARKRLLTDRMSELKTMLENKISDTIRDYSVLNSDLGLEVKDLEKILRVNINTYISGYYD